MATSPFDQLDRVADRLLENVPFFKGLSKADLFQFLAKAERVSYTPGATIFSEGDKAGQSLYIIVKGQVEVRKKLAHGGDEVVDMLDVGQCFGEMALIDNQPRSATVVARTDCISLVCTSEILANFQTVAFRLYENLARIIAGRYLEMERQLKAQLKPECFEEGCMEEITSDMPAISAEIGAKALDILSRVGHPYNVPAKTCVFKENTHGQNIYFVIEGELEERRTSGNVTSVLTVLKRGNYFGELALVSDGQGRTADVVAVTDIKLIWLNSSNLQNSPKLGAIIYRELAHVFSMRLRRSTMIAMRTLGQNCHQDCKLESTAKH